MTKVSEIKMKARESADRHTHNLNEWAEHRIGFICGAEWMERTMLARACEVLKDRVFVSPDIVTLFRQAMEHYEEDA